jgi:phosphoribosylformylglycinamidine synthase
MVGYRIGKDGIRRATFVCGTRGSPVSAAADRRSDHPEKDVRLPVEARDQATRPYRHGAGGLSSSVGEMARKQRLAASCTPKGALKYAGLQPWEILLSGSKSSMTLAVPPSTSTPFWR